MRYVLILSFLVFASAAFGTVYSWVDHSGVRHYANRMYDVPERYRTKVKALYPEPSDVRTPSPAAPEQQRPVEAVVAPPVSPSPPPVVVQAPVATGGSASTVRSAPAKRRERRGPRVRNENDE